MFEVDISARAERDLLAIVRFITRRSPSGAAKWIDAFEAAVRTLATNAESNPRAPENADHSETIRNLFFKTKRGRTYRAIYIFRNGRVFITHVRGPGQNRVEPGGFYGQGQ